MIWRIPISSVSLLLFSIGIADPQQPPTFHTEVNLVNVTALIRSDEGELITDLKKDDFEVLEDGVPQHIQFFAREKEIPLSLALILDVSGSQDKFISQHNRDVEKFLTAVLAPADRAVVVCFGNHLRLVSDSSASAGQIMEDLRKFGKGSRDFPEIGPQENRDLGTALYDAVYFTIGEKLKQMEERRKAIVLFSDGEENSSEHDLLDAIEAAQNANAMIYSIRYTDMGHRKRRDAHSEADEFDSKLNARNKYGIRVMKHLANQTGGNDFDALKRDLDDVFEEIGTELHSLYSIGYLSTSPARDAGFRKLTVRCKRANTVVRAKSGYYAR